MNMAAKITFSLLVAIVLGIAFHGIEGKMRIRDKILVVFIVIEWYYIIFV